MKKIIVARSILHAIGSGKDLFGRGTLTIIPARTSEEILNLHGVHHADVIITDLNLPMMGGAKLCATLRNDAGLKQVSIIMACEREDEARNAGVLANAFLPAPVDAVQVFSKVAELLVIQQRRDLRVLLRATLKGERDGASFFGMCHNISISGMLMETDFNLGPGDQFTCSFRIAHRDIAADCRVVRTNVAGARRRCAVLFQNLDTRSLIMIDQYVKNQIR